MRRCLWELKNTIQGEWRNPLFAIRFFHPLEFAEYSGFDNPCKDM